MIKLVINATLLDEQITGIGQYQYSLLKQLSQEKDVLMNVILNKAFIKSKLGTEFIKVLKINNPRTTIIASSSNKLVYRFESLIGRYLKAGFIYHDLSFNSAFGGKGTAKVVTFHDAFFLDKNLNNKKFALANLNARYILPWSANNADHLIVQTQVVKNLLVKGLDLAPEKITVIPMGNPADEDIEVIESPLELKDQLNINGNTITKPYFLTVGAGHSRKRTKDVIQASLKVAKKHQLVITGKNAQDEPGVNKLSNINNNVKLLDYVSREELVLLYRNAAGLFFPSCEEGFGFPIIEALKYKIPVFATDIDVFKEVGASYINYFGVGDIDKIANYMSEILSGSVKRNDNSEVTQWLQKYTWSNYTTQLISVYKKY
ncbi:glycosyltransferase [Bacillus megaterium]|uniref:glycosyltransferase family 4 protein n=1 Tax=Priestia megaterium TaxID=1404 RepID=UPI001293C2EF|nr:glycosyltransferase family 1 protein [Priestia megaterium]MQR87686.1 glycosyltransferase [Priestia megaterium]